jgi:hypothetical protein
MHGFNRSADRSQGELCSYLALVDVIMTSSRQDAAHELNDLFFGFTRKFEQMKVFRLNERRLAVALLCEPEAYDKIVGGAVAEYKLLHVDQYAVPNQSEKDDGRRNPADVRFSVVSPKEAEEILRQPDSRRLRYVNTKEPGALEASALWPDEDPLDPDQVVELTFALALRWRWMQDVMGALLELGDALAQKKLHSWDDLRGERDYIHIQEHVREEITVSDLRALQMAPVGDEKIQVLEDLFERVVKVEIEVVGVVRGANKRYDGRHYDSLALRYVAINDVLGTPTEVTYKLPTSPPPPAPKEVDPPVASPPRSHLVAFEGEDDGEMPSPPIRDRKKFTP